MLVRPVSPDKPVIIAWHESSYRTDVECAIVDDLEKQDKVILVKDMGSAYLAYASGAPECKKFTVLGKEFKLAYCSEKPEERKRCGLIKEIRFDGRALVKKGPVCRESCCRVLDLGVAVDNCKLDPVIREVEEVSKCNCNIVLVPASKYVELVPMLALDVTTLDTVIEREDFTVFRAEGRDLYIVVSLNAEDL